jgi:hypothetical protein
MPSLSHKRGTRAQIYAAATANQLRTGELYLITDEGRLTVGTSESGHSAHAKQSEIGGAGAAPDMRRTPVFWTDFMNKNTPQPGGFDGAAISAGGNGTGATVLDQNHPGQWLLVSSATANSGYRCTSIADLRIGGGEVFDFVFRTMAAFTGTTLRAGFHDSTTSADAVDGCYFEFSGTGAIVGKTSSNSVRSTTATLATLAVNTWYHIRLTVNANATSVLFEVFNDAGVLQGSASLTTNIPTVAGRETAAGFVATNSGTVATQLITADYMSWKSTRTLARGATS